MYIYIYIYLLYGSYNGNYPPENVLDSGVGELFSKTELVFQGLD